MRFQGPLGIRTSTSGEEMKEGHLPVLVEEVMSMLAPAPGSLQIDATVGGGGHTERILEASSPDGRLLGIDADGAAIARTRERLKRFGDRVVLRQANFRETQKIGYDRLAAFVLIHPVGMQAVMAASRFQVDKR